MCSALLRYKTLGLSQVLSFQSALTHAGDAMVHHYCAVVPRTCCDAVVEDLVSASDVQDLYAVHICNIHVQCM